MIKIYLLLILVIVIVYSYISLIENKKISNILKNFEIKYNEKIYILSKDLKYLELQNKKYKKINDKKYKYKEEEIKFSKPVYQNIEKINLKNIDFENKYIPKIIWQTFKEEIKKDNPLYQNIEILKKQKGYEYKFINDKEGLEFLKNNFEEEVWKCYQILIPGAYKADLLRVCLIYIYGGVYVDIKVKLNYPLDFLINNKELLLTKDLGKGYRLWNGFFASKPKHPFIKNIIDHIVYKVKNKQYGVNDTDITGPHLWAYEYIKYFKFFNIFYNNYEILQLIDFKDKLIISNNNYEPFLEYKRNYHNFYGKNHKHYVELWKKRQVYDLELWKKYFK